jgi:hypothetical protein
MLIPLRVFVSFANNLVSAELRPYLGPAKPVYHTKEQNTDTNDGKYDPWITLSVSVAIRRNEWDES